MHYQTADLKGVSHTSMILFEANLLTAARVEASVGPVSTDATPPSTARYSTAVARAERPSPGLQIANSSCLHYSMDTG